MKLKVINSNNILESASCYDNNDVFNLIINTIKNFDCTTEHGRSQIKYTFYSKDNSCNIDYLIVTPQSHHDVMVLDRIEFCSSCKGQLHLIFPCNHLID